MFVAISSDLSLPAHHSASESGNMKKKLDISINLPLGRLETKRQVLSIDPFRKMRLHADWSLVMLISY